MMGDYTEHLISMAGGDGEPDALDLYAIQARRESYLEGCSRHYDCLRSDMAALLALAREQAAQIERVRGAQPIDGVTGEAAKYAAGFNAAIEAVNELLTATDQP